MSHVRRIVVLGVQYEPKARVITPWFLACVDGGFDKGVCFNTPFMTPHGVHATSYKGFDALTKAQQDSPRQLSDDSLWIMFESTLMLTVTKWATKCAHRVPPQQLRDKYDFPRRFDPTTPGSAAKV